MWTPKDRITAAFRNERPDSVPVSPELWDVIPYRVSGRPFHEFSGTSFGTTPLWKAQLDAYRFFSCEAWIPVEHGPSPRQSNMVKSSSRFVNEGLIETDTVYTTQHGTLRDTRHSCFDYDLWAMERAVKDIETDMPALADYFFEDPQALDYSVIENARTETGDDGICEGIIGNTFFEFLTSFREGGAVQVIFDLHEHPDYFTDIRRRYTDYLAVIAEETCLRTAVDGIFLNCGSSSLDIIGPELFRTWDIPVIRAVADVARRHDKIFHYHLHGKGRKLLDDIVDAGVTMICPLETEPHSDFDLAEVKRTFGNRLALKGGIDPFLLRDADEAAIDRMVRSCLDAAADGGGYTLATGDGVLGDTPFDSIRLLVELTKKYGAY